MPRQHPVYLAHIEPGFVLAEEDLERLLMLIKRLNRGESSVQSFPDGIRIYAAQAKSLDPGWYLSNDPKNTAPVAPPTQGLRRIEFDDE